MPEKADLARGFLAPRPRRTVTFGTLPPRESVIRERARERGKREEAPQPTPMPTTFMISRPESNQPFVKTRCKWKGLSVLEELFLIVRRQMPDPG